MNKKSILLSLGTGILVLTTACTGGKSHNLPIGGETPTPAPVALATPTSTPTPAPLQLSNTQAAQLFDNGDCSAVSNSSSNMVTRNFGADVVYVSKPCQIEVAFKEEQVLTCGLGRVCVTHEPQPTQLDSNGNPKTNVYVQVGHGQILPPLYYALEIVVNNGGYAANDVANNVCLETEAVADNEKQHNTGNSVYYRQYPGDPNCGAYSLPTVNATP